MNEQNCENCRFYRNGECHRNAPVTRKGSSGMEHATWPYVGSYTWCGQWEAQPAPSQPKRERAVTLS
jgi:hypothetical protein